MAEKIDITALYGASLSPRQKTSLLAAYRDYVSLARNLEYVVRRYKPSHLAGYQIMRLYDGEIKNTPWNVTEISPEAQTAYRDFVANKVPNRSLHYCYVSLNRTSPAAETALPGIISAPPDYNVYNRNNMLPARIERYVAAYHKGEMLSETQFVIDGNWMLSYNGDPAGKTLQQAFEDPQIEKRFSLMLDVLALLPKGKKRFAEEEVVAAQNEALASALVSPFENVLLSSFSGLVEESHIAVKSMLGGRCGGDYLVQAEKDGMIPGASAFQDYLNIRHLLHHQWDTLDGMGKFNAVETEKNTSIRRRYLESYGRLCSGTLLERMNAYAETARSFSPLVAALNPNFLRRGDNESNSKFCARLKEYSRSHPAAEIFIEANYPYNSDKKEALIKNAAKLVPSAKVIDAAGMDIEGFLARVAGYLQRMNYIEVFQEVEYRLCQHCLFCGKNYPAANAWAYFRNKKILSPEEAERWGGYKQLRNTLSHRYLDSALLKKMLEIMPAFMQDAIALEDRIAERRPEVNLVSGSIYRAVHKNGTVVDIDFSTQSILNIGNSQGQGGQTAEPERLPRRQYTEEYPNGLRITVAGTEIISCRLANGIEADLKNQKLVYPDGSKFYLDNPERNFLTLKGNIKLITDKGFKVVNYIVNGKSISIAKNETVRPHNTRGLAIGSTGSLSSDETVNSRGITEKLIFKTSGGVPEIRFADGTRLMLVSGAIKLSHAGIGLSYRTRKAFAESYAPLPPVKHKPGSSR